MSEIVHMALRLGSGGNDRKHWRAAKRQKDAEKAVVGWSLKGKTKPALPCVITIIRISPGNGLDSDNLVASAKYVRDTIAEWLGVDDKHEDVVRYAYAQERGPWGVRIDAGAMQ